ncbi:MAG: TetR/AcrR family transcriptional regulator [Cyanobacteria bacterium P01_G01_bin.54]
MTPITNTQAFPSPTADTRLTDRKRAAILAAAAQEFQKRGFERTSMDRIATTANVSKRTVYNHFASKEILFQAIVNALFARSQQMTLPPYTAEQDLAAQLLAMGQALIEIITSDEFMQFSRVVVSRFVQSPELATAAIGEQTKFDASIVDWIEAASADDRLTVQNPHQAATQFTSLIKAFAFWPQLLGGKNCLSEAELEPVIESAVAMFLAHYRKG